MPVPWSDPRSSSGRLLGLLVPAAEPWPCQVLTVDADALDGAGGESVEEILTGAVSDGLYAVHGRGAQPRLPDNGRAAVLVACLGFSGGDVVRRLRGDVLVTGVDARTGRPVDVPGGVLVAAAVCGVGVDVGSVPLDRRGAVLVGPVDSRG